LKKYSDLGALLVDYRKTFDLSQLDVASRLEVDVRTVARWEKNVTLIQPDKEQLLVESLSIPHQVIHNLNSERPIAVFYDIERRVYSHTALGSEVTDAGFFKEEFPTEPDRIRIIGREGDIPFIIRIKELYSHEHGLGPRMIEKAVQLLPDLNRVLLDQSGFYAGHSVVFPLKVEVYEQLRNQEILEHDLKPIHLAAPSREDFVYFIYSIYADSLVSAYLIMAPFFQYFRQHNVDRYTVAGLVYKDSISRLFRQMGLKVAWETTEPYPHILLEGDFDMYLFGTTR